MKHVDWTLHKTNLRITVQLKGTTNVLESSYIHSSDLCDHSALIASERPASILQSRILQQFEYSKGLGMHSRICTTPISNAVEALKLWRSRPASSSKISHSLDALLLNERLLGRFACIPKVHLAPATRSSIHWLVLLTCGYTLHQVCGRPG